MRKTCTEGRSSMLQDTTEALLVLKTKPGNFLDEGREFSDRPGFPQECLLQDTKEINCLHQDSAPSLCFIRCLPGFATESFTSDGTGSRLDVEHLGFFFFFFFFSSSSLFCCCVFFLVSLNIY